MLNMLWHDQCVVLGVADRCDRELKETGMRTKIQKMKQEKDMAAFDRVYAPWQIPESLDCMFQQFIRHESYLVIVSL